MKQIIRNVIIIGCGPHFRERYFDVLQSNKIHIVIVIDLFSQKEKVLNFFSTRSIVPDKYLFLPEEYRNAITIEHFDYLLKTKVDLNKVDAVIICSEPKAHKIYALWAIQNGLHIFSDKPLSAFTSYEQMDSLYGDYLEIIEFLGKKKVNFVLSCERRAHLGYKYIKKYISDIISEFTIPITYLDIHFGGGMWNMPDEFFYRENHPYKYGYGVLLHSGYHYIDLFMSLILLNEAIIPLSIEEFELHTFSTGPYNFFNVINNDIYFNLLKTDRFKSYFEPRSINKMKYFGETDLMVMGRFKKDSDIITNFNIKLMETSVSKRNWHLLPENTYLSNGRIRQENLIIHIGHLCSIHIRSNPYSKLSKNNMEDFSIDIMNNSTILRNEPLIQIERSDFSKIFPDLNETEQMNTKARQWQLFDFLSGGDGNSPLLSHKNSIKLLDKIYQEIKHQNISKKEINKRTINENAF